METTVNATVYELINKATLGVYPCSKYSSGTDSEGGKTVTVCMEDGTEVVFDNKEGDGQLFNETFAIREVTTHEQPDGTGTVEIQDGEVVLIP